MARWLLIGFLVGILAGCGDRGDKAALALAQAEEALALARRAMAAHDDGTSSGTTLASEVEEAKNAADSAQRDADDASVRIDELEGRIQVICANAPNACY